MVQAHEETTTHNDTSDFPSMLNDEPYGGTQSELRDRQPVAKTSMLSKFLTSQTQPKVLSTSPLGRIIDQNFYETTSDEHVIQQKTS